MKSVAGKRGPRSVDLHCVSTLRPNDVTERNAIPVTTLPRTLIDLATILEGRQLKSALRQAERIHRLDLRRLRAVLDDFPAPSPAPARLRHLLVDYVPTPTAESELEATFLELCANHGIARPETQVEIGPYRVDFLWPAQKLVVETDGRAAHDTSIAFRDDRARDRALAARGLEVQRFTGNEVLRAPRKVARELSAALKRRR